MRGQASRRHTTDGDVAWSLRQLPLPMNFKSVLQIKLFLNQNGLTVPAIQALSSLEDYDLGRRSSDLLWPRLSSCGLSALKADCKKPTKSGTLPPKLPKPN